MPFLGFTILKELSVRLYPAFIIATMALNYTDLKRSDKSCCQIFAKGKKEKNEQL